MVCSKGFTRLKELIQSSWRTADGGRIGGRSTDVGFVIYGNKLKMQVSVHS